MNVNLDPIKFIESVLKVGKYAKKEISSFLEIGVDKYIESQIDKYYFTNTFLHRGPKVKFDDVYFRVKAAYGELSTDFSNLESVFDEYKNIFLSGVAGSGKSTLVKSIFLNAIRQSFKIPVIIELRHLNIHPGDLKNFIIDKLTNYNIKPSNDILFRAINEGAFLFLFDGFDEIYSENKQKIEKELTDFMDGFPLNNYIVTSRPGAGMGHIPRLYRFMVQPLENDEMLDFIDCVIDDDERKKQIKLTIKNSLSEEYFYYLKSPLMLSMFILVFESHPEIPSKRSAFYRNVFDTLYSRHDGITKGSFPRERLTKLPKEDFENIISMFSYMTFTKGVYSFTEEILYEFLGKIKSGLDKYDFPIEDLIKDLETSLSILIKEGFEYRFPHRSLQEYFAALFISKIPNKESKEKVYKSLRNKYMNLGNDNSYHFWFLCKEIDYEDYLEMVLISELLLIKDSIYSSNKAALVANFFSFFIFYLIFSFREDYEKEKETINLVEIEFTPDFITFGIEGNQKSTTKGLFYWKLLSHEKVYDIQRIEVFLSREPLSYYLFSYMQENYLFYHFEDMDYEEEEEEQVVMKLALSDTKEEPITTQQIFELTNYSDSVFEDINQKLVEFGFADEIDFFLNTVDSKIKELKKEILQRNNAIDDILDF